MGISRWNGFCGHVLVIIIALSLAFYRRKNDHSSCCGIAFSGMLYAVYFLLDQGVGNSFRYTWSVHCLVGIRGFCKRLRGAEHIGCV